MKYLLLDTNIYLHYIDFEQIDWGTIIGDKEYEIVVPYTVIKEIDKYKDGPKSKIKVRAFNWYCLSYFWYWQERTE